MSCQAELQKIKRQTSHCSYISDRSKVTCQTVCKYYVNFTIKWVSDNILGKNRLNAISICICSALPRITVWSEFCETVELQWKDVEQPMRAAKTSELWLFKSKYYVPLSVITSNTFSDKCLWSTQHRPCLIEICLNRMGGPGSSAIANKPWARQILLAPRLQISS